MNKKGGAMVESVMVLPVVVLSVVALISIMTYFYVQLSQRVDMHIMLRAECGEVCKNIYYGNQVDGPFPAYKKAQQLYSEGDLHFSNEGILENRKKNISARKYLIDETKFVRMTDTLGDVISENEK